MVIGVKASMIIIKNVKYDIYQFAPIIISCKNYSRLLDATIKINSNGLKLDISYLEINDVYTEEKNLFSKKFYFSIKRSGDPIEDEYEFLRVVDVLISDSIEKYYIFYKEECSEEENRQKRLNDLGI